VTPAGEAFDELKDGHPSLAVSSEATTSRIRYDYFGKVALRQANDSSNQKTVGGKREEREHDETPLSSGIRSC
jgi:hypothetical protein